MPKTVILEPGSPRINVGSRLKTISLDMSVKKLTKPNARIFLKSDCSPTLFPFACIW